MLEAPTYLVIQMGFEHAHERYHMGFEHQIESHAYLAFEHVRIPSVHMGFEHQIQSPHRL